MSNTPDKLDPKIKELFEDIEEVSPFLENTWSVGKTKKNNTMSVDELWRSCKRRISKLLRPNKEDRGLLDEIFAEARTRREEEYK